jgi:hypothetical protein
MTAITFDTRKAVRKLQANGFDSAQADALVDTLAEAFSDTVATKADVANLKAEMADLKAATHADVANLKAEMFRALWIQGAGIVGLVVALTKLL